jgi:hypothetical protein
MADDEDFGDRIDRAIREGFSDEEILMQIGPESHELLVALIRVRKKAGKPMPMPETNASEVTVNGQEMVILLKAEFESMMVDYVCAANALQVSQDESDPVISDDHS